MARLSWTGCFFLGAFLAFGAGCSDSFTPGGGGNSGSGTSSGGTGGTSSTGGSTAAGGKGGTGGVTTSGGGTGGAGGSTGKGASPTATINHPGDMETRPPDMMIPFIGVATDAEDGDLTGNSLVWTSDQIGQFGTGAMFDSLLPVGTHVVTLTATDSDGNTGTDSITLYIVAP